jgi:hypothetical protein
LNKLRNKPSIGGIEGDWEGSGCQSCLVAHVFFGELDEAKTPSHADYASGSMNV